MPDITQLPHLIRLLDDDSPVVREAIERELLAFGPDLEKEIAGGRFKLSPRERDVLQSILDIRRRVSLKGAWAAWRSMEGDGPRLEKGLSLIAEFQNGPHYPATVPGLLDELATEYKNLHREADEITLATFLFQTKAIRGATDDYYHPWNSNLVRVVERRRGIPISLACLYMRIGARLGLDIKGCNYPGHFLARILINKTPFVVDCFNGGKVLDLDNAPGMTPEVSPSLRRMIRMPPDAETILHRVLRNLARAYEDKGNHANRDFMLDLLKG